MLLIRAHDKQTALTSSDVDAKLERALQRLQSSGQVSLDETRAEEQVQGVYESSPFPGAGDYGVHIPVTYSVQNLALALGDEPLLLELPDNNNMSTPATTPADQSGFAQMGVEVAQATDYVAHVPTEPQIQMPPHLERRFWFVESCEGAPAAVQLLTNRSDGTFLIRPSTSNPNSPYSLSVM